MTVEVETRSDAQRKRRRTPQPEAPSESSTTTPQPPRVPGRRNPKWIASGIVALCLGALLSYVLYAQIANQTTVIEVVHTIHRGETLRAADLTTVKLNSGSGVHAVPASEFEHLVGRKAVYDLVADSLLPVGAVADVLVPSTGHAVVGVRLVAGRSPVGLLIPGSPVRLVAIPPTGADPDFQDDYTGRVIISRVVSQVDGADGTSTITNVDVPASQAPTVALLASQERLAVVRDADR
jgi:hypothetical protein